MAAERKKVKATLRNAQKDADCYVPGCYNITVEPCEGIPFSNKCASCKKKKVFMGVEDS